MKKMLKKIAARLPSGVQHALKHAYFHRQIRHHRFNTPEPEFDMLRGLISPGDCVLDIGANIGQYTIRMSNLVGPAGRVIALEPVPDSFELLTSNVHSGHAHNVTLINAAASDSSNVSGMVIGHFEETGLDDFYTAKLVGEQGNVQVFCISLDSIAIPLPVRLAKIDTEGHELKVINGMLKLLNRDHPVLIVEDNDPAVPLLLSELGYASEKKPGSPNRVYRYH